MTTYTDVFGGDTVPPSQQAYKAWNLTADQVFTWPELSEGDSTLPAINEVTATAGLTLTLPDASQVSTGRDLLFRNVGAETFTLVDAASGAVTTIVAGVAKYLYLTDNSSAAGVWTNFTYGTGTSAADAASLDGYGLSVASGLLQQNSPTRSLVGAYTVALDDRAGLILAGGGSYTIDLPTAASVGEGFFFHLNNTGSGTVTLDPSGAETIDGSGTKTVPAGGSCTLFTNGANWYSVGFGRDIIFAFSQYTITTTSGSITLTAADVSGRMIRVGNPLVGNLTVNLPASVGVYYGTSTTWGGGYSATFQVTGGLGDSVQISTGQSVILSSDGTDIVSASTIDATGNLALSDGSAVSPAINFLSDTNTGIYRKTTDTLGISAGGVQQGEFSTTGFTAYTAATLPSATTIGTVSATEISYLDNVTSSIQTQLDSTAKLAGGNVITGTQDLSGAALVALPANTVIGTVSATEISYLDNVTSAIQTQLNAKADITGETYSGTHDFTGATTTAATQTVGDNTTNVATTAFVAATAFTSALPAQTGNAGKVVTTDGAVASWEFVIADQTGNSGKLLTTNGTATSWIDDVPPAIEVSTRTSNTILAAADNQHLIDITSGTFSQTFTAAATLGNGWFCYIRNSGTGTITLDPNGGETINGASTYTLSAGNIALVQCDGSNLRTVFVTVNQLIRYPIFDPASATLSAASNLEDITTAYLKSTGLPAGTIGVRYANSLFLAATDAAASNIASSPDGDVWTLRAMPTSVVWNIGTDGNNCLAKGGASTAVATSTNGTVWASATATPLSTNSAFPYPVGISGTWIVGGNTSSTNYVSTDFGVTWSAAQTLPAAAKGGVGGFYKINGKFWYVGAATTAYYSTTGLTGSWSSLTLPVTPNIIWVESDGSVHFAATGAGAQVYKMTNESTAAAVPVVITPGTGLSTSLVNGVYAAILNTSACGTYHLAGRTLRTASVATWVRGSSSDGTRWVLGTSANADVLTYSPATPITGLFTR